ncbi:dihydrolipoyl dehydrogenase [[Mycoplasma] mobile]|uniref:Dihydrolipoyl dehydrogenase n=1 Tax=Mycoplasma mobile (strain ATCC 43663 / 163K / NCTC 11711) TaxID=267748 RepID=Q6KH64_MYCM1|nr:dihydrolipoyl dehydrogenase [[Mycoplasma] mobile]AAT28066.1 pyruvate dehydrogenase E3 component dihydrolipoamide dehydrogenase [Mycoplasma mobile 163K]
MFKFKFADIGEGLHEGLVAEIYKKEGDMVKEGEALFSVETDKVTSDIPSPATGKIVKVAMAQGDTIHVGQEIYYIDDGSSSQSIEVKPAEIKAEAPKKAGGGASVVGEVAVSDEVMSFGKKTSSTPTSSTSIQPTSFNGKITDKYDVIVLGSGPGGYLAAEEAGKNGKKTLIIEKEYWGGVCLNVGCIPTKALLKSTEVFEQLSHASDYGLDIDVSKLKMNWKKMQERKQKVVNTLVGGVLALMKGNKVKTINGEAKFLAPKVVQVNGEIYEAENIIIATGSKNRKLTLPGFEEAYKSGFAITAEEAIQIESLPKELVIIGGGVIGIEFAQIFAASGSKVTVIQNAPTIIPALDEDVIKVLSDKLISSGIQIVYNAETVKIEKDTLHYKVNGEAKTIKASKIMVSVGRIPVIANAKEVGYQIGEKGEIVINEFCQTNIPGAYAIGDVTFKTMLAHVAYQHAHIAIKHLLGNGDLSYTGKTVPACIYTHPEIASVGMSERQAKESGRAYISEKHQMKFIGKAIASDQTMGFSKLIIDKETHEILGAHIIGAHATDLISELVVAIDLETTVHEIANAIHPHPTFSEIIWENARTASHKLKKK